MAGMNLPGYLKGKDDETVHKELKKAETPPEKTGDK
jgi:hypothetical protein